MTLKDLKHLFSFKWNVQTLFCQTVRTIKNGYHWNKYTWYVVRIDSSRDVMGLPVTINRIREVKLIAAHTGTVVFAYISVNTIWVNIAFCLRLIIPYLFWEIKVQDWKLELSIILKFGFFTNIFIKHIVYLFYKHIAYKLEFK